MMRYEVVCCQNKTIRILIHCDRSKQTKQQLVAAEQSDKLSAAPTERVNGNKEKRSCDACDIIPYIFSIHK